MEVCLKMICKNFKTRNKNNNYVIVRVKPVKKTKNGGVTVPEAKDIKQLYEYLINGKYRKG